MALGKFIAAEGGSRTTSDYRITIYNDGYTGSVTNVQLAGEMFTLNYEPDVQDIGGGIIPSNVSIYFILSSALSTKIDTILEYQLNNKFPVLIEKDTGSGYEDFWRGVILQDQFVEEDKSAGTVIEVKAVCGLAYLKSQDFGVSNTITTPLPYIPVKDLILELLKQGLTTDLWGASDNFLKISVNWWEDGQTYSALGDPTITQLFDTLAFLEFKQYQNNYWTAEVPPAYEVLQEFCKLYYARVYMANGYWVFEQLPMRANQNVKQNEYDKSGTQIGFGSNNLGQAINQKMGAARLAGNLYEYYPALKKVTVEQNSWASSFDNVMEIIADATNRTVTQSFGTFDTIKANIISIGSVNQQFIINVDFPLSFDFDFDNSDIVVWGSQAPNGFIIVRPKVRIEIKLDDIASSDVYYWNGTQWTTTASTITINGREKSSRVSALASSGTIKYRPADSVPVIIQTDNIPVSGTLQIIMDQVGYEIVTSLPDTYTAISNADPDLSNTTGLVQLTLKTKFDRADTIRLISTNSNDADIADSQTLDIGKIKISDGSLQTGNILIDTGSNIARASSWNIGNGSEGKVLGELLTYERLNVQALPLETYNGSVITDFGYQFALVFDSAVWIAQEYELQAVSGVVTATWVKLGTTTSSSTGSEVNPANNFFLSGQNQDAGLGSFKRIGGLLYGVGLQGGSVYDDSLGLMAVPIPQFMSSGQRNNYTELTAEATGSDTLSANDCVVVLTWSGSAGTYTLNIPDASDMDGARLEVILDDTFTASTDVNITPASGNIQGEVNLTLNEANTKVQLRAVNGNWY